MGSNNSKGSKVQDLEFTGPIRIMHDKYGSAATHQCDRWEKLGFPKKGSFSPNQIELLKIRLQEHETKYKRNKHKWKPDWDAVVLWTKETTLRQEKQTKGGDEDKTAEKKTVTFRFSATSCFAFRRPFVSKFSTTRQHTPN